VAAVVVMILTRVSVRDRVRTPGAVCRDGDSDSREKVQSSGV
jgi:hypothetical protein